MNTEIKNIEETKEYVSNKVKYSALISEIKRLSQEQISLKNQRKTIHLEGERTVDPYKAVMLHQENKRHLRHMYRAYTILRGKEVNPLDKSEYSQTLVDFYIKKSQA